MRPRSARAAFTLIEILTSLGIILVLAAILFPVYASSRKSATQTACLSNLSQISKALLLYGSSNDEAVPTGVAPVAHDQYWMESIGLWQAPSWGTETGDVRTAPILTCPAFKPPRDLERYHGGYGLNECLDNLARPRDPSITVLVGESGCYKNPTVSDIPLPLTRLAAPDEVQFEKLPELLHQSPYTFPIDGWAATRHRGRANYAFVDGHVSTLKPEQFRFPLTPNPCEAGNSWAGPSNGFLYETK